MSTITPSFVVSHIAEAARRPTICAVCNTPAPDPCDPADHHRLNVAAAWTVVDDRGDLYGSFLTEQHANVVAAALAGEHVCTTRHWDRYLTSCPGCDSNLHTPIFATLTEVDGESRPVADHGTVDIAPYVAAVLAHGNDGSDAYEWVTRGYNGVLDPNGYLHGSEGPTHKGHATVSAELADWLMVHNADAGELVTAIFLRDNFVRFTTEGDCAAGAYHEPQLCFRHSGHHFCETCNGHFGVPHDNLHSPSPAAASHPYGNIDPTQCACRACTDHIALVAANRAVEQQTGQRVYAHFEPADFSVNVADLLPMGLLPLMPTGAGPGAELAAPTLTRKLLDLVLHMADERAEWVAAALSGAPGVAIYADVLPAGPAESAVRWAGKARQTAIELTKVMAGCSKRVAASIVDGDTDAPAEVARALHELHDGWVSLVTVANIARSVGPSVTFAFVPDSNDDVERFVVGGTVVVSRRPGAMLVTDQHGNPLDVNVAPSLCPNPLQAVKKLLAARA